MFLRQQLLWGALMPALIAAFFIVVALKPWQRPSPTPATGRWGAIVGLGLAYLLIHAATKGAPAGLPHDALDWVFYLALAALVAGLFEAKFHKNIVLVMLLRVGLALLAFWLSLGFMREYYWSATSSAIWLAGLTLGTLAIVTALDRAAEKYPGATAPVAMVLLSAAASAVLVKTGNAKIGLLMAGLMATSFAVLIISWFRPSLELSRGPMTVFGLLFAALLTFGYAGSADIPALNGFWRHAQTTATLLVAIAPLFLWVDQMGWIDRRLDKRSDWIRAIIRSLIVAIPLAIAIFIAAKPAILNKYQVEYRTKDNKIRQFEEFEYEITDEAEILE